GEDLAGLQAALEKADEEVVDRDGACAAGTARHDRGVVGQHGGRMVVGRIGVREVATDGGPVAHQRIGDHPGGVEQQRVRSRHDGRFLELVLARERANGEVVAPLLDVGEVAEAVDVDEHLGRGEAETHRRQETLAAGQYLGAISEAREEPDRLVERSRRMVLKGRWDHIRLLQWRTTSHRIRAAAATPLPIRTGPGSRVHGTPCATLAASADWLTRLSATAGAGCAWIVVVSAAAAAGAAAPDVVGGRRWRSTAAPTAGNAAWAAARILMFSWSPSR